VKPFVEAVEAVFITEGCDGLVKKGNVELGFGLEAGVDGADAEREREDSSCNGSVCTWVSSYTFALASKWSSRMVKLPTSEYILDVLPHSLLPDLDHFHLLLAFSDIRCPNDLPSSTRR